MGRILQKTQHNIKLTKSKALKRLSVAQLCIPFQLPVNERRPKVKDEEEVSSSSPTAPHLRPPLRSSPHRPPVCFLVVTVLLCLTHSVANRTALLQLKPPLHGAFPRPRYPVKYGLTSDTNQPAKDRRCRGGGGGEMQDQPGKAASASPAGAGGAPAAQVRA